MVTHYYNFIHPKQDVAKRDVGLHPVLVCIAFLPQSNLNPTFYINHRVE
jgi:hypothetical protein